MVEGSDGEGVIERTDVPGRFGRAICSQSLAPTRAGAVPVIVMVGAASLADIATGSDPRKTAPLG